MFAGVNNGRVDENAMIAEMKSTPSAYLVLVGNGRSCEAGLERRER